MRTFLATMALLLAAMPARAGDSDYTYIMPQDEAAMLNSISTTESMEAAPPKSDWRATEQDVLAVWERYYQRPYAFAYSGTRPADPASRSLLPVRPGKSTVTNRSRVVPPPAVMPAAPGKSAAAPATPANSATPVTPQTPATPAINASSASPAASALSSLRSPAAAFPAPASTPAAAAPAFSSSPASSSPSSGTPANPLVSRPFEYNPPPEIRPSGAAPSLAGEAINNPQPNGARAGDVRLLPPPQAGNGGNNAATSISSAPATALPPSGQPTSLLNVPPKEPSSAPLPAGPYQGSAPAVQDRSIPIGK